MPVSAVGEENHVFSCPQLPLKISGTDLDKWYTYGMIAYNNWNSQEAYETIVTGESYVWNPFKVDDPDTEVAIGDSFGKATGKPYY